MEHPASHFASVRRKDIDCRCYSHRDDLADLYYAFAAVVFALIGDEFGSGGGERGIEVLHGLEIEVSDGVVIRRRSMWKGADAAVDFNADEPTGSRS